MITEHVQLTNPSIESAHIGTTAKSEATARRIAQHASVLFFDAGYQGTTVARIAAAADVATGTVLLHFGSKSELATAAFAEVIADTVAQAGERLPAGGAIAKIAHVAETMYAWYRQHERVAPELLQHALFSTGEWAEHYVRTVSKTTDLFRAIVHEHQVLGELDQALDPALVADGLIGSYLLVLLQGFSGRWENIDDQLAHFVAIVESQLRTSVGVDRNVSG